jgi:hypothetical protein
VLLPAGICVASGLVHASLWLDEITYYYGEGDMSLRAAELGRPGSPIAPHLGIFFFCDVQRLVHSLVEPLGLTVFRDPELYLRLTSIVAYAVAALALWAYLRRRLDRRSDALLGALAFSSTPILLHYAFDARVYAMTTMLVVLLAIALDAAARTPSRGRLCAVAALALLTAHSHLWTLCLFAALLAVAGFDYFRERGLSGFSRSALAAAVPALVLIGAQVLYMKATDPGAPLFPPFRRQDALFTLVQLGFSNFSGVLQTQYLVGAEPKTAFLAWTGVAALAAAAVLALRGAAKDPAARRSSAWTAVSLLALFFCWALAATYGYYTQARYHVPLMGMLFFAVTLAPSRPGRLALGLIVAVNAGLLPATVETVSRKGSVREVAGLVQTRGTRDAALVCQHVVTGGFPLPAQAIGLDFYLNLLHPDEPPIPIYELPDLALVNGRRGVYDLFAGSAPLQARYLASRPETWRRVRDTLPPNVFVLEQFWNVPEGLEQSAAFEEVMLEMGAFALEEKYFLPGFPRSLLVEFRRK